MWDEDRDRLCRRIVEGAQDAIIVGDREGLIRLWNTGAAAVFGYGPEEAVGKPMDFIIPENLRARHWEGYRKVMASGVTRYGSEVLAVPALRKGGERLSIEFTIVMLKDGEGKVEGVAAIIRDVTARWRREKALKERLAALEAEKATPGRPASGTEK
jgi:PAS domain S-box-containing protein